MNVNVTVELEISLCQHHVTTGFFLSSPYLCLNKVSIRDFRGRGLGSVNLVVSK